MPLYILTECERTFVMYRWNILRSLQSHRLKDKIIKSEKMYFQNFSSTVSHLEKVHKNLQNLALWIAVI